LTRKELTSTPSLPSIVSGLANFNNWKKSINFSEIPIDILETSLNQLDVSLNSTKYNSEQISQISVLLSQALLPLLQDGEWIWYEGEFTKALNSKYKQQNQFVLKGVPPLLVVAIHWIKYLRQIGAEINNYAGLIKSLLCYTIDSSYPWSIKDKARLQTALTTLVDKITASIPNFYELLLAEIKPVFIQHTTHPSVSSAGRRVMSSDDTIRSLFFEELERKENPNSWRTKNQYALGLLEVYLTNSQVSEVQSNWSFLLPCVLNIVDNHDPAIKRKGSDLVYLLVTRSERNFLVNTGVVPLLWKALKPSLAYLPPSTPASISIPLTKSTYKASIALSNTSSTPYKLQEEYLQDAVLSGISHTHTHTKSLITFINITSDLVLNHLKSYTTPHLKSLVSIVVGTLSDPLVTFSEELVIAACNLSESLIRVCWYRIIVYRYDLVKALILISRRLANDKTPELINHSRKIVELLIQAVQINIESTEKIPGIDKFANELSQLAEKEPTFRLLLPDSSLK
jgi:hypothetical protein